jgi:adenylate kinase
MRAVITGQVGMDKKPYLKAVQKLAGERGETLEVFHVGDLMYAEAADVKPGRILDLPLSRLASLRRSAFKDIISQVSPANQHPNVIVNTHATFRWRHGLFAACDFDLLKRLQPDMFICMVDNVEVVHARLHADVMLKSASADGTSMGVGSNEKALLMAKEALMAPIDMHELRRRGPARRRDSPPATPSARSCSSTWSSTIPTGTTGPTICRRGTRTRRRPRRS